MSSGLLPSPFCLLAFPLSATILSLNTFSLSTWKLISPREAQSVLKRWALARVGGVHQLGTGKESANDAPSSWSRFLTACDQAVSLVPYVERASPFPLRGYFVREKWHPAVSPELKGSLTTPTVVTA